MNIIYKWLLASIALSFAPYIIPGITVANFYSALIAAFVLGILSITVKPILTLLTLPINLITFGLFTLVLNALIFWFLSTIIKGINIDGFVSAFLGSLFVSVVIFIADKLFLD